MILDPLEEREITEILVPPEVEDRREALANQDNRDNQVDRYARVSAQNYLTAQGC